MMNILIINIDSEIPNLALKKIEKYHKDRGDYVDWDFPMLAPSADIIYVSVIFTWNKYKALEWQMYGDRVRIGGSGWDFEEIDGKMIEKHHTILPSEIEAVKPKINLGFTTRGCVRGCKFCIVAQKEGKVAPCGDIYDIWDGKSKEVRILDNNILGLPEHFKKIAGQIKKEKIRVEFDALDARLLNDENTKLLSEIKHEKYKFAFDDISSEPQVVNAIQLLLKYGVKCSTFYVLTNYNSTVEQDLYRLNLLRGYGQTAFVQLYNGKKDYEHNLIANWSKARKLWDKLTFTEYLKHREEDLEKNKHLIELDFKTSEELEKKYGIKRVKEKANADIPF